MSKRLTTEEFIERAKKNHGDKYDYSKVNYIDFKTKICIICSEHGEFWQTPNDHLHGSGCMKCGITKSADSKKYTKEEFVKKAREIHGNKYDYSKSDLLNRDTKNRIVIICPMHGEFWQTPTSHLSGNGCLKCVALDNSKRFSSNSEEFIQKARKVHGDKYDYSKVKYINAKTKVCIICPKHGEFWQQPYNHLAGKGCPKCNNSHKSNREEFIKKARQVHGDKYDYSKVDYVKSNQKVCIICPEHGEFWQTPNDHLCSKGCLKCGIENQTKQRTLTTRTFIERSELIHNHFYDYSQSNYINAKNDIKIICPKHGEFWQNAYIHMNGCGCPACKAGSSNAEKDILKYIQTILPNIEIVSNTRKFLNGDEIDILIPSLNIGFEYNGLFWHTESNGKDKKYHLSKTIRAAENGIHLIHIFEDEWMEHEDLVKDKICHMLHKDSNKIKIGARKCQLKEISVILAKPFLKKYHIQGFVNSTLYYGAFYEEKLIGVMSFLREKEGYWNLTRFSTNINYAIPGLANKLFKFFVNEHNNEIIEVKTFLDRRWSWADINVYDRMGFNLSETLKPNYYYVKGQKRFHKFGFRKQILHKKYNLPLTMTEDEMTKSLGYERIWDCGLFKYVWRNVQKSS